MGEWRLSEPQESFFCYKIPSVIFFKPYHEYFLGLIGVHEFFSFTFPLPDIFLCTLLNSQLYGVLLIKLITS